MVGYGNSAIHDKFDRSIRAQAEMIDGLLDQLGLETVSFVGHDLVGGVGLRYAAHQPESVSKLVLSNAACYDSWPGERIVDLGLPATIEDLSVDDLQELLRGIDEETLYGDDPTDELGPSSSQGVVFRASASISSPCSAERASTKSATASGAVLRPSASVSSLSSGRSDE